MEPRLKTECWHDGQYCTLYCIPMRFKSSSNLQTNNSGQAISRCCASSLHDPCSRLCLASWPRAVVLNSSPPAAYYGYSVMQVQARALAQVQVLPGLRSQVGLGRADVTQVLCPGR